MWKELHRDLLKTGMPDIFYAVPFTWQGFCVKESAVPSSTEDVAHALVSLFELERELFSGLIMIFANSHVCNLLLLRIPRRRRRFTRSLRLPKVIPKVKHTVSEHVTRARIEVVSTRGLPGATPAVMP